jgi:hypothetical protein
LIAHGRWFSPVTPASFTTKTGGHDIASVAENAVKQINLIKSNQNFNLS